MTLQHAKKQNFGTVFIITIIIIIALAVFLSQKYNIPLIPGTSTQSTSTSPGVSQTGTVLVGLKDKSQRVDIVGTINELVLTVTKVEVHYVGNSNDTNASGQWMTVFEGSKTVDLLTLTNITGILGQQDLPSGKYTQIRLTVKDVIFNVTNSILSITNKRVSATVMNSTDVPSGELRFIHPFTVTQGKTTALILDFDVTHSVTKTENGYILKPVIQITDELLEKGQRPENSVDI